MPTSQLGPYLYKNIEIDHSVIWSSPVQDLALFENKGSLVGIFYTNKKRTDLPEIIGKKSPLLREVISQLKHYFKGNLERFDVPMHWDGTPFQKKVWKTLTRIPYGKTWSYGDLTRKVGNDKAYRAVGTANGRNPISIIVPCHRVIATGGTLGGYGGGLDRKKYLLNLESPKKDFLWSPSKQQDLVPPPSRA